jgi:transglutaminase-like putative cysteine protease
MRITVRHATSYVYDPPPDRCALRLRLYPAPFEALRVLGWIVSVNGAPIPPLLATANGGRESIWTSSAPGEQVEIVAAGEVETKDVSGVVRGLKESVRPSVYLRRTPLTEPDQAVERLAASVVGNSVLDRMHMLMAAVREAIDYESASTHSQTTAAQALKLGAGVCQDHAHVFISAARVMQVPARYVVGYLFAPDTKLTETHAWAEAHVPDIGWVGFDPANRLCPTDRYVRLGCGLDSADAAPIRGSVAGTPKERLSASVDIGQAEGQSQGQQ